MLGLVCALVGGWFVTQLGTSGTATFTAAPGDSTLVLPPDVLNRTDSDVTVSATADGDAPVWMGLARPSDVDSVMQDAKAARAQGVSVTGWELETTTSGSGSADPQTYDLWQGESRGTGQAALTVTQDAAPQTLVVTAGDDARLSEVTMTVTDSGWSTRALVLLVVGLVLLVGGVYLAVRGGRGPRAGGPVEDGRESEDGREAEDGRRDETDAADGAVETDETQVLGTADATATPDTTDDTGSPAQPADPTTKETR
ncbi:hypothetical protein AWH69_14885 [Janibacter melonis]|uniref:Uncharacterized protein n=1 Tax=Janibacter melonis TaxID=262209 RepID=A0A176Q941_9MICO|nr:hypothetical protein AWH69_14885 [Janibacter melonis]